MSEQPVRRAWFKRHAVGVGASPGSWQGWLVLAVYVAIVSVTGVVIAPGHDGASSLSLYLLVVAIETAVLLAIARWKSDGPWFGG